MKEIERLRRERYSKMINLLPELIVDKMAPSFFYFNYQRYIDWDSINLDHIQVQPPKRDDHMSQLRRRMLVSKQRMTALNIFGNQKQLRVNDAEIHTEGLIAKEEGNPIQFVPYSLQRAALYDKGCITCGKANIIVKYHKDRHVCLECRQKITTSRGDPVIIFQDDDQEVVCLGIKQDGKAGKQLYEVASDDLEIFGYKCYVTFSGPDDLIVLLHDKKNETKGVDPRKQKRYSIFQSDPYSALREQESSGRNNFIKKNILSIKQSTNRTDSQRSLKIAQQPAIMRHKSATSILKRPTTAFK